LDPATLYRIASSRNGQRVAASVDRELQVYFLALRVLAISPSLQIGDLKVFRQRADYVIQHELPGSIITLTREDGQQVMNTRVPAGVDLPKRQYLGNLAAIFANGEPRVSDIFTGAVSRSPIIGIEVPVVNAEGRVIYDLAVSPPLDTFTKVIQRLRPEEGWLITILDRNGAVVGRSQNIERFLGQTASPSLLAHLLRAPEGLLVSSSLEGQSMLTAFTRVEPDGWSVAVGIPSATFLNQTISSSFITLGIGAIVIVFGLALSGWEARHITGPIGILRRLAASPDKGILPSIVATGLKETDEVAKALREAAEQRQRSAAVVRAREAHLRLVTENARVGLVINGPDHRYRFANKAYTEILGLPADDIVGKPIAEVMGVAYESQIAPRLDQAFSGKTVNYTLTVPPRGQEGTRYYDVTYLPSVDVDETPVVIVILYEITDRLKSEVVLRDREARLRLATEAGQVGIFDWHIETANLDWDSRLKEIWEVPLDGLVTIDDFYAGLHPDDVPAVRDAIATACDSSGSGEYAATFRVIGFQTGKLCHLSAKGRVTFEAEKPIRMVGTVVDISLQREAEAILARDKLELEELIAKRTTDLQEAQKQLLHSQKMDAIGQLTGGIAHDFNNLLTAVMGNLDLLLSRETDTQKRRRLEASIKAAERGSKLTTQLLAFARKQRLCLQPVDLRQVVTQTTEMLSRTLGGMIKIEVNFADDLWPVIADPNQCELVLLNLALNARDAMPQGGRLTITVSNIATNQSNRPDLLVPSIDYVMLSVTDSGTGMTEEVRAKAFDPFFTTKEIGAGTGLGLSQVHGIVYQSGGQAEIDSQLGIGTTVKVFLLRSAELATASLANNKDLIHAPKINGRVLIVDDDDDVRQVIVSALEAAGCAVVAVSDGKAALDLLSADKKFDLAILDYAMPLMNGDALRRRIHALNPVIPILFITGYSESETLLDAEKRCLLLKKPFHADLLISSVQKLIDPSVTPDATIIELLPHPRTE